MSFNIISQDSAGDVQALIFIVAWFLSSSLRVEASFGDGDGGGRSRVAEAVDSRRK